MGKKVLKWYRGSIMGEEEEFLKHTIRHVQNVPYFL